MLKAMWMAFSNLFRQPVTKKYPFEATYIPSDFRGEIKYNEPNCIFCLKCEAACPPGAIIFDQSRRDGKYKYHYNPYLCIYCGECVRACPEPGKDGALWQDSNQVNSSSDKTINDRWFVLEDESAKNREAYKLAKKERSSQSSQEVTQKGTL